MTEQTTNNGGNSQAASGQSSSNSNGQSNSQTGSGAQGGASQNSQQSQANQQQNNAPARPSYVLESEWDATAGRANDKFGERVNRLTAFEAEQAVRRNSLPASENDYQVKLPNGFQAPQGVSFEFDMNDPAIAQARKIAKARGVDQETFSDMLGVYASSKIGEQQKQAQQREAHMAALGAAGPQRVDAVATWLTAKAGQDGAALASFIKQWPSAPMVKAMENLIRQFSSQGGADFSQSHREGADAEAGKIPGYDKMNFQQRRAAQMAERMKTDPNYARGLGR